MDSEVLPPSQLNYASGDLIKCSNCECTCSLVAGSSSALWLPSVKRKFDEFEQGNKLFIPGVDPISNARVQIENECAVLREAISSQQQMIEDLFQELEEERNAASSAANEAMSMILRLQREKAELLMEARQFKGFADDKMAHDQQEIEVLEDLLYKREQAVQSLIFEVQAYKHRMVSYGFTEAEVMKGDKDEMNENLGASGFRFPGFNYPPLRCDLNENPNSLEYEEGDVVDIEKCSFTENPDAQEHMTTLGYGFSQIEKIPESSQFDGDFSGTKDVVEKVIVDHSTTGSSHIRRSSADGASSFVFVSEETGPDFDTGPSGNFEDHLPRMDYTLEKENTSNWRNTDNASEVGDDTSDRVYTVDYVDNEVPCSNFTETNPGKGDDYVSTLRDQWNRSDVSDPDIKKLYTRIQALEADRESLRQTLISMRADKAQMVILKEIAQHLRKEMSPERQLPMKRPYLLGTFSLMSIFEWVLSFMFWRRKAQQSKYTFGLPASNVGLLMILEKSPRTRQWRCLLSTQV